MAKAMYRTGSLVLMLPDGGRTSLPAYGLEIDTHREAKDFDVSATVVGPFGDAQADALWLATCGGDALAACALADRLRELGRA